MTEITTANVLAAGEERLCGPAPLVLELLSRNPIDAPLRFKLTIELDTMIAVARRS